MTPLLYALRILFVSIFASFGGFISYDYFATPALHGIISGDILLFFVIWLLPRKSWFKIILIFGCVATAICFNPIVGICLLYIMCISFVNCDSIKRSFLLVFPIILFSVVSECAAFFKNSFMMDISQIWEVSSFFWWGGILFFVIPLGYAALIVYFSKEIFKKRAELKPIYATIFIPLILFVNIGFTSFQNRMDFVDFPVYRHFWDYNIHKSFGKIVYDGKGFECDSLSEDSKKIFKIWNQKDSTMIKKKSVFILVESYGLSKNTTVAKHMIFEPFKNSNVAFAGVLARQTMFTYGAELEDMGVSRKDSLEIQLISALKLENVKSWYMHGYEKTFYSRDQKYRQFGFDSLLFISDLKERNSKICNYGFEGICDSSMIIVIDSILNRPSENFVFWTTLDSHPPYKENLSLPAYSVFCKDSTISDKMCVYLSLIENTLEKVALLAQKHPDYQFVIRGDHRPMATVNPNEFYYGWVPMVILN